MAMPKWKRVFAFVGAAGLVAGGASFGAEATRTASHPDAAIKKDAGTAAVGAAANDEDAFKREAQSDLQSKQFARLDARAEHLVRTRARFPGGDWKSERLISALSCPRFQKVPDEDLRPKIAALQQWRHGRPASMTAAIALVYTDICYAWQARGDGYSDSVTPEGWRLLRERMDAAEGILLDVGARAPKTPDWYRAMIDLGRINGWEPARVSALFQEAKKLEPRYLPTYDAMAMSLMPRWQGNEGAWERFADESADQLGGREGSVVYGDIAWRISRMYRGHDFYVENRVSWPRLRQGFIDREALYGTNLRVLNAFCKLAGSAGDRATTRALLERIGDHWDPETWTRKSFDNYRTWAFRQGDGR